MRDRYIYILVPQGPKVKHLELCAPPGFARLSSGLHNDSPLTIRNNKMSLTERQRLSTKRYPLETPDFGARSLHSYFGVKRSQTERQRFSTKRYPFETPDFGARSLHLYFGVGWSQLFGLVDPLWSSRKHACTRQGYDTHLL